MISATHIYNLVLSQCSALPPWANLSTWWWFPLQEHEGETVSDIPWCLSR